MGSSGGGSAGKVAYPTYLMDLHSSLLNNTGVDTLSTSAYDLLTEAHNSSPYDSAITYTGRSDIGSVPLTVAATLSEILSLDINPLEIFQTNLAATSGAVNSLFDLGTLQTSLVQASAKADVEYQHMLGIYDSGNVNKGIGFSSARVTSRVQPLDTKMRAVMRENLEDISKSIVQLNSNKLEDALVISEQQYSNLQITRSTFALAIEMCKLQMLNEREYFEQTEFYAKYGGHWEFECMQEVFNLIAVSMGRKMTWIGAPDASKWVIWASILSSDPRTFMEAKKNRKFRTIVASTVSGSGTGYVVGGIAGAINGGLLSGILTTLTYSEGEWR